MERNQIQINGCKNNFIFQRDWIFNRADTEMLWLLEVILSEIDLEKEAKHLLHEFLK